MKQIKIECNILHNGEKTTAGLVVYDGHENGKPIHEKLINCKNDVTEVVAYILKNYIINKKLSWNNVTYKADKGVLVLYGEDMRG